MAAVGPIKDALPVLHATGVAAFVGGAVDPLFEPLAVLLVLEPFPLVICTVLVEVDTEAVGLVVLPLALVEVAVRVDQPTLTAGLIS